MEQQSREALRVLEGGDLGRGARKKSITEDYKERVKTVLDESLEGKETAIFELPRVTMRWRPPSPGERGRWEAERALRRRR